jgi:2-polyprenyl-3-methyl-5-hydroxy-6-metoxy-1,4-benzoquinol methylase
MPIGPRVRRWFGPAERSVAAAYRSLFIDLDALLAQLVAWAKTGNGGGEIARILEVGCGEGAVTGRLADAFPRAEILAIDVSPALGRMCGASRRIEFRQTTVAQVASESPRSFDLVLLSDVLHHVPAAQHDTFVRACGDAVGDGGMLFFKDWVRTATPIHTACYLSDRFLTGDRVTYYREDELLALVARVLGPDVVRETAHIAPWRNNVAMLIGLP